MKPAFDRNCSGTATRLGMRLLGSLGHCRQQSVVRGPRQQAGGIRLHERVASLETRIDLGERLRGPADRRRALLGPRARSPPGYETAVDRIPEAAIAIAHWNDFDG